MRNAARTSLTIFILLILILAGAPIQAEQTQVEAYPEEIAQRLQEKYDSLTSLAFTFNQSSRGQLSGRPKTGAGKAYFHKSDNISRMRWDYTSPDTQVLISDGETFSMYFAELNQMIVTPADSLDSDLTYSFFSGREQIGTKFHILPPDLGYLAEDEGGSSPEVIKLVPVEPHSQVQDIHLWVNAESLIRRIEIRDHFDTVTLINIRDLKVDFLTEATREEMEKLFSFTPPENTEIIHQ